MPGAPSSVLAPIVAMPGAPSSVLAPIVAMPGAPSSVLAPIVAMPGAPSSVLAPRALGCLRCYVSARRRPSIPRNECIL